MHPSKQAGQTGSCFYVLLTLSGGKKKQLIFCFRVVLCHKSRVKDTIPGVFDELMYC